MADTVECKPLFSDVSSLAEEMGSETKMRIIRNKEPSAGDSAAGMRRDAGAWEGSSWV